MDAGHLWYSGRGVGICHRGSSFSYGRVFFTLIRGFPSEWLICELSKHYSDLNCVLGNDGVIRHRSGVDHEPQCRGDGNDQGSCRDGRMRERYTCSYVMPLNRLSHRQAFQRISQKPANASRSGLASAIRNCSPMLPPPSPPACPTAAATAAAISGSGPTGMACASQCCGRVLQNQHNPGRQRKKCDGMPQRWAFAAALTEALLAYGTSMESHLPQSCAISARTIVGACWLSA